MSAPSSVSVCMATYNGAAHVEAQLMSILEQLQDGDEVVIVDDASTDDTRAIVGGIDDDRVRLIPLPVNRGYVRAFETAVSHAAGDVILLADQDDVWIPGRRDALAWGLGDTEVVASNLLLLGTDTPITSPLTGRPWILRPATSRQHRRNLLRILAGAAPYYGCAMGMRSDFRSLALPFPPYLVESHDLWLAILANRAGSIRHLAAPSLWRRLHEGNASSPKPRGLIPALKSRWMLMRLVREAGRRVRASGERAQRNT
ncbi:glycosyltransferase [Microbacterium sp. P02]|uniref:glycosyltransferase n=1 Tax=Microbacterium sp. P02 TaxID=3366260 RepID=UPI00366E4C55